MKARNEELRVGSLVEDTRRHLIAVVMDHVGPNYQLRPPSGGREWDAEPDDIRPLTPREALTAKVREANRRSSQNAQLWKGW